MVAHKGSVDICTRKLVGKAARPRSRFLPLLKTVPFCCVGCCEENKSGKWALVKPAIATFTHMNNSAYNWKIWV